MRYKTSGYLVLVSLNDHLTLKLIDFFMNATKSKEEGAQIEISKKMIFRKKLGVVKGDDLFEKDSQLT